MSGSESLFLFFWNEKKPSQTEFVAAKKATDLALLAVVSDLGPHRASEKGTSFQISPVHALGCIYTLTLSE